MTNVSFPISEIKEHRVSKVLFWIALVLFGAALVASIEKSPYFGILFLIALVAIIIDTIIKHLMIQRGNYIVHHGSFTLTEDGLVIDSYGELITFSYDELVSVIVNIEAALMSEVKSGALRKMSLRLSNKIEVSTKTQEFSSYKVYIDSASKIEQLNAFLTLQNNPKLVVKQIWSNHETN